jgi:hypothetical protein
MCIYMHDYIYMYTGSTYDNNQMKYAVMYSSKCYVVSDIHLTYHNGRFVIML